MGRKKRNLARVVAVLALVVAHGTARAAPAADVEAWVLAIDGFDVIVDVGQKQGAAVGDVVELWRPLKLKHPVTGKLVTDRFRIGALRLTQVQEKTSLARPDGALARPVEAGDVVVLHGVAPPPKVTAPPPPSAPPAPADPKKPQPPPEPVPSDPEAAALSQLFEELRGAAIETRVKRYEAFAKAWPKGRFRIVLLEEAMAFRQMLANKPAAPEAAEIARPKTLNFEPPTETLTGTPLTVALEVEGAVAGAVLQLRGNDETTYTPLPMVAAGPRYYRVTLPSARVRPPSLTYFIEAVLPDGTTVPIEGTAASPRTLSVIDAPKAEAPRTYLSTAALWTDYADYNRLRRNDWAWQTEGYFGMRFGDVGLRALRSGFGVYNGRGGSIHELDIEKRRSRAVGLSYGYLEAEWGVTDFWGILGRAVVGLSEDGITGGGQAFVRIGNDRRTNMLLGGEILGGVGIRGIWQLELNVFRRFPLLFRSEVTNQPAGASPDRTVVISPTTTTATTATGESDIGVRVIGQAGYRIAGTATLFVRGSYQGRTINHAGPGVGAGVSVEW